jgi:molecular chaperone DnaK
MVQVAGAEQVYQPVPDHVAPDIKLTAPPPLLLDVTPLSLGVETVGGFCHTVIPRNTAMPAENTQTFSTGRDGQTFISVRICQGEEKALEENQVLGVVELDGLRDAARGTVRIDVTFIIDADGALAVEARDLETGRAQAVRVRRVGEIDESELDALRDRMEARFRPGGELAPVGSSSASSAPGAPRQ